MDFTNVSAVEVDAAEVKARRTRPIRVLATPFVDWLRECHDTGKGKRIELPNKEAADEARVLIRQAANYLNIGSRSALAENADGTWIVSFKAAEKRAYKPRESEDSGELDAAMAKHPAGKRK